MGNHLIKFKSENLRGFGFEGKGDVESFYEKVLEKLYF